MDRSEEAATADAVYRLSFRVYAGAVDAPLASGDRTYTVDDIRVEAKTAKDGHPFWSKTLLLASDWAIGAHIARDAPEEGFGLFVVNQTHTQPFSWNWFAPEAGDVFRHIKCGARVGALFLQVADGRELAQVAFHDDTPLSYSADLMDRGQRHSHRLVVLKGSVLCIAR